MDSITQKFLMDSNSSQDYSQSPHHHVVVFPFMAKGHTIPLLHLLRLLRRRFPELSLTVFATASHRPFISHFLSDDSISILDLSFPQNAPGLPAGVESTETLPTLSLFPQLCLATKLIQPEFERKLRSLLPVTFLISDMFLWWTVESASKFGIPRIYFSGMSNFSHAVTSAVVKNKLLAGVKSGDEAITIPDFPWLKVTRNDWEPVFWPESDPESPHSQFIVISIQAAINSYGSILNSFYELEPVYYNYNSQTQARTWNIGPVCMVPSRNPANKPTWRWLDWLNRKLDEGKPVLYVAFGSQVEISCEQVKEIEIGLMESGVNFLWAKKLGKKEMSTEETIMELEGKGIVVREWVDQWEVLKHESVRGFLSHCGWNSVAESLSCGVPILAFPVAVDQGLNARFVVEELRAGMRATERLMERLVKGKDLERMVKEFMEGEKGEEVRKKAMEVSEMAKKAMAEDGSSWRNLGQLVEEMCSRSLPPTATDLSTPMGME